MTPSPFKQAPSQPLPDLTYWIPRHPPLSSSTPNATSDSSLDNSRSAASNGTGSLPSGSSERTRNAKRSWFIDPQALMQIKSLTLRAKTVVEGFTSGLHRSPLHGFSVEFAQYRPYVLGDDPRNLDWKLLARTDRCYVKQYEDETNRRCYIAIDQSRSMAYAGKTGYSKAEYARTLAATLAYYLHNQRDAVGLQTCGTEAPEYLPPRNRPGHLQQLMHLLERESVGSDSDLSEALLGLAGVSKRRGLVILLSDMLSDPEPLFQPLGYLKGRGHEIIVIRILDRSEIDFQLDSGTMVEDMETGQQIYVDPTQAAASYRREFEAHEAQLIDILHRRGGRLITVGSDAPVDAALLELISNTRTLGVGSQTLGTDRRSVSVASTPSSASARQEVI
ncbi:MAG: DUF58 domain-containing protein [Planctomycetota bacterium]